MKTQDYDVSGALVRMTPRMAALWNTGRISPAQSNRNVRFYDVASESWISPAKAAKLGYDVENYATTSDTTTATERDMTELYAAAHNRLRGQLTPQQLAHALDQSFIDSDGAGHLLWLISDPISDIRQWIISTE